MHSNLNLEDNIQVNDEFPLHSTVEPQTTDPARETAPRISKLEPPAVPPRETAPRVPEFEPPNVSTRESAPEVSELEPPTIPLAASEVTSLVSLLLYTQPLPCATLNPEGLLLPELEALQYKEATPS
jgi:hypothetical protein